MATFTDGMPAGILGFFGIPGHWEIVIIVLVVLLLFGAKKLPELAQGLGRGLRSFKEEITGVKTDIKEVDKDVKESAKTSNERQSVV
jgi:sec-independent protein translocase protein TatA